MKVDLPLDATYAVFLRSTSQGDVSCIKRLDRCADPEKFIRGGPTLTTFLAVDGPILNAGLVAL